MPEPADAENSHSLHGCRVLVARPAAQAAALCALIEAAGGRAQSLPLIEIVAVADPATTAAQIAGARKAERWIFTSTNAVRHAAELVERPWPPVAAVGAATASALTALGCVDVLQPQAGDGAAALLAHPAFAQVRGQCFALISGEQPLPNLEAGLRARGAKAELIAVYRRQPVAHSRSALAAALAGVDVAIVPSGEALQQLVALTPGEVQHELLGLQLALPSARVVEIARSLGFRKPPLLPLRVSDAAYVDILRHHCRLARGIAPP